MRLNQFIASSTGCSRRAADDLIAKGQVLFNGQPARFGQQVTEADSVELNGKLLRPHKLAYIMLNKPVGYVCSRSQQGSEPTIYSLLPPKYSHLKPVGRLDKDSSGLLLLTNDGTFAQGLTHPSRQKAKLYEVELDSPLKASDQQQIEQGVMLKDGTSKFEIVPVTSYKLLVTISEGRNRQLRRTFGALGYTVTKLHRTQFGHFSLNGLKEGAHKLIKNTKT